MEYQLTVTRFLDHCKHQRGLSPHTIKAYRLDLNLFRVFVGEKDNAPNSSSVDEFLKNQHALSPASKKRRLATLRSLGDFLVKEGLATDNPARRNTIRIRSGIRLPRVTALKNVKQLIESSSLSALDSLSKKSRTKRCLMEAVIIDLLFSSGMRVTEISHLRLSQLDLSSRRILAHGKGNKERIIPIITTGHAKLLDRYLETLEGLDGTSFVFGNNRSRRLSEDSIRRIIRKWCRKLALPHITPHMLRHTVATQLLNNGVDLRYIQRFLGHSSLNTTTIYAQVLDERYEQRIRRCHPRNLFKNAG